jgi:hypothetical protein
LLAFAPGKRGLRINQKVVLFARHENLMQAENPLRNGGVKRRVSRTIVPVQSPRTKIQDVANLLIFRKHG